MGTERAQEFDIYWTQDPEPSPTWTRIDGTGKGAAAAWERFAHFVLGGDIPVEAQEDPLPTQGGATLSSPDFMPGLFAGVLTVRTEYGGTDTGDALKAERLDEFAAVIDVFDPDGGEGRLRFDRLDRSGSAVSTVLFCRISSIPTYKGTRPGSEVPGPKALLMRFGFRVLYPLYVERVESSETVSASTSVSNITATNDGGRAGVGLAVRVGSITSGTPKKITIANSTTGQNWVIDCEAGFTAGDYISWFSYDPRALDWSTTNEVHFGNTAAGDRPVLDKGDNSLAVSLDAGTASLDIVWHDERLSP